MDQLESPLTLVTAQSLFACSDLCKECNLLFMYVDINIETVVELELYSLKLSFDFELSCYAV